MPYYKFTYIYHLSSSVVTRYGLKPTYYAIPHKTILLLVVNKVCFQEYLQILLNTLQNNIKKSIKSNVFLSPSLLPDYSLPLLSIGRGHILCETAVNFTGLFGNAFIQSFQSCQEMEKKGLTATSFLKSAEIRDKYECGICYEVCMKPIRCKGPCKKIYCMKCVSDTRQEVDRCPLKCSEPFLVERLPEIQLDFFCPYNPTECHMHIDSLKAFDQHYRHCPYVSPEDLHCKKMQAEYKCLAGHQLQFFVGSYEEMLESNCVVCKDKRLCRSYCRICSQLYCVGCRVPPCAKEGCPIGHAFSFQQIANLNFICDICGVSTAVSKDGVYDDSLCNFGICEDCFSELPDHFDQSKPRELIANINTQCSCGHVLSFVDGVYKPTVCTLCTKVKECPRYCTNCQKSYCISCKLMDINFDNTCGHDHDIVTSQPAGPQEHQFGCMRCGKEHYEYCYDRECRVRLCPPCVEYCRTVTTDKQRPITLKCQKNHVLVYITGSQDWYDYCVACKKEKSIKLRCMYCSEEGQSYCFQCRPIPLETCYYKHPLRLAKFQSPRECHFCRHQTSVLHFCKKCYFYACEQCHAQHRPALEEEAAMGHKMEKKESVSTQEKMEDCKMEEFDPDKLDEEL